MKGKRNEKRSKKSAILKQHARNLFVGVVIVLFVSMSFSAFFVSAKEKDTPDHESTYIYYNIKVLRLKKAILCGISQMKIFLKNIVRQKNMLKFLRR